MPASSKTPFQRVLAILFVVFACGLVVSLVAIGWHFYQSHQENAAFEALRQEAPEQADGLAPIDPVEAYNTLKSKNADYDGWINIPGTHVDYPVMATPENPEYYLRRAFDKTDSASGTPFIGEGCDQNSDCLIIYGHDMDNGTMFGDLALYEDAAFRTAHPLVSYYTKDGLRSYEIFAALKTRILNDNEAGYRYYNAAGAMNPEQFKALTDWLKTNAIYDTGITPMVGEQILILSTCDNHTENGRFLVAARRVAAP